MRAQATLTGPFVGVPAHAVDLPRVARVIGVVAAAIGLVILATWWARAPLGHGGQHAMMPSTAAAMFLAGASLALRAVPGASATARSISRVLAIAVTTIGTLALLAYLFGTGSSFGRALDLELVVSLGRASDANALPAPNTALGFASLGVALFAMEPRAPRGLHLVEIAAAISGVIALVALYGHVYGAAALHEATRSLRTVGMSTLAATMLLLLSIAVVLARPRAGVTRALAAERSAGRIAARLFGGLFVVPILGLLFTVGHARGLYTQAESAALLAVVATVLGGMWIVATARVLDRAEQARDVAAAEAAKWKLFFEHADWGAALARPDGTLALVNAALARQHGLGVDALRALRIDDLFAPEHRAEAATLLAANARAGHARLASEHVRDDGSTFPVRIAATALRDAAGRLVFHAVQVEDVTAERAVETERARFASLVQASGDAIVASSVDGKLIEWNPAAERLYGWRASEMLGKPFWPLIPPEQRRDHAKLFARLVRGERVAPFETVRMHKDGRRVPVSLTVWPVIGRDGRVLMLSASARDISARLALEDELRRANRIERELRDELERVTRASSVVADELAALPDTSRASLLHAIALQAQLLTSADAVAVAIAGERAERQGFEHWAVIAGDPELERTLGHPDVLRALDAAASDDAACDGVALPGAPSIHALVGVPVVHRAKSVGRIFVAHTRGGATFTEADVRVVRMLAARVGPAIEIASAYEALSLESAWLGSVIDQMPEGVVLTDARGAIVSQNEAALRLSRPAPPGSDAVDAFYEVVGVRGEALREDRPLARVLERGESVTGMELALRLPDARVVPILASATPVRVGDRAVGAVLVFRDISVVKELERMREQWASVVAHDLRQPLAVITMSTGVLRHLLALRPSERKTLDRIQASTRTLTRMVDDLLDASRIEARQLALTRRELDLCALAREVMERNANLLAGHELELVDRGPAKVRGDAQRLEQVLVNLVANAHKYGDADSPIRVEIAPHPEQREVEILVSNRGRGIPPEELPRVFDRFSRARAARSSATDGLGLGLYICRGIVEAHGGRVSAESTPGETTTFRVVLPCI